jgi:hypothetical protein
MTRSSTQVLEPMSVVVLALGDGEPMEPDQLAGPACVCPGAGEAALHGLEASKGGCLWFVRWVDQAELAVCLPAGDVPVFVELRRTLERLVRTRLEVMPPANHLPA